MKPQSFLYLDEKRLHLQALNNQKIRDQLVDSFLMYFPEMIGRVENALQHKDGHSLARAIHMLKASLGIFSVDALVQQAERAELLACASNTNEMLLEGHLALAKAKVLMDEVKTFKENQKSE